MNKIESQRTKNEISPDIKKEDYIKQEESSKVINEKSPINNINNFNNDEHYYYMDNEVGKDHEDYDEKNLKQLLQSFDNNVDINSIILIMNRFLSKHSKKLLDKENLVINLYTDDLDKFEESKQMQKNFSVSITYAIDASPGLLVKK